MAQDELVLTYPEPGVAQLQFTRPEARNTFTWELLDRLENSLSSLAETDTRVLLITGSGNAFCAGADLKLVQSFDEEDARRWIRRGHEVLRLVERFPVPVIAVLNGHAVGGGLELACACDLRISVRDNKLGLPEAKLGMIPGWGGLSRLQALIGPARTRLLVFTGQLITGEQAAQIGLVDILCEDAELSQKALDLAKQIAAMAPLSLREIKTLLTTGSTDPATRTEEEADSLARCVASQDQTEGLRAFFEKRKPAFSGR